MKVLHLLSRFAMLWVWAMASLPVPAPARSPAPLLPNDACGSPEAMGEAQRAGAAMVQQVLAAGMPWSEQSLNEYVNRLGQNLARTSGSQEVFTFYVLYEPRVNAQAFPGGYIVINSGVISLAESEGELASVLSHEIAHENLCDWRTVPGKCNLFELIAAVPAVILGGPAGIVLLSASGFTAPAARARVSRSVEQRADRLGAQYLALAGYDPHAAEKFFERLQAEQEQSGGDVGGLLATHPRTSERRKELEKIVPTLSEPAYSPHDEKEFLRMRKAVRDYDAIYSRIVGVHVPGREAPPPALSRRPPLQTAGTRD